MSSMYSWFVSPISRYLVALGLISVAAPAARAQVPAWQQALSGPTTATAVATATAVNATGDVFVTGYFSGQVTIGATVLTSAGNEDVFVAKWSTSANAWAWVVRGGGASPDLGNGIAVNGSSIYLTGRVGPSATFGSTTLAGTGSGNLLLGKYTDNGSSASFAWGRSEGGTSGSVAQGFGIAVSGSTIYTTGNFESATSTVIAGSPLAGAGSIDVFVARYTDAGSSATNGGALSGGGPSGDAGNAIAVSGANVYVTGTYYGLARFGNTTLAPLGTSGSGTVDLFLAKYTDTGAGLASGWAVGNGGPGDDQGNALAVSGSSVYLTGSFAATAVIAGFTLSIQGTMASDIFVAKYTDTGPSVTGQWAARGGGNNFDIGTGIAVSGSRVYVTGYFDRSASIANTTLTGRGSYDAFVARYIDAGSSVVGSWALSGGSTRNDFGNAVAVSGNNVYVVGATALPTTFGTTTLSFTPANDSYFLSQAVDIPAPTITSVSPPSAAPNTTVVITGTGLGPATTLTLNGQALAFTVDAAGTTITFSVPTGTAAGLLVVGTPGGQVSTGFCVEYLPRVTPAARCGPGSLTLVASGSPNVGHFAWYTQATGGTAIPGETGPNYIVPNLTATTTYYVAIGTGSGTTGCEGPRVALTATVNSVPATPAFTVSGNTLTSSSATGNQWYLGGTAIAGATGQTHLALSSGTYTVVVTSAAGCPSAPSAAQSVVVTAAQAPAGAEALLQLFPNPAQHACTVLAPGLTGPVAELTLVNAGGQIVRRYALAAPGRAELDLRGLAPGLYQVRLATGTKSWARPLAVE